MKKKELKKELLSYCRLLVVSVILALVINSALIANAQITSGSMETTIMTGDRVIGNRLAYNFTNPKRGDRKSTRLNSSHAELSRMPSSA